jgi:inward rectifier potassium channel
MPHASARDLGGTSKMNDSMLQSGRYKISIVRLPPAVVRVIDENSPLAGYDAEQLEEGDARLFLSIEARDHAIGALVHDMRIYTAVDVLFGMHYAEAVTVDDQRRPVADLTRLSLVEPDPSALPD